MAFWVATRVVRLYVVPFTNNSNEQPAQAVNSDIQCLLYDGYDVAEFYLLKMVGKYIIRDF